MALVALLVLDFLAVHPFQDGNGRIARLLSASELLRHGYGVEQVRHYVLEQASAEFRFVDVVVALPDISQATIRNALNQLARDGRVESGRGRSAVWRRRGSGLGSRTTNSS